MRFLFLALLFCSTAFANGIDDTCPKLTYKHAPIVTADQFVCHQQYAVAFSYKTHNPIYTTEFLDKSHTSNLPRTNDFKVDPAIPKQYQTPPSDYIGAKCGADRCDKGHMTPDQDFSACAQCVHESFYMSNMVPQSSKNNEVIWKQMEVKIRAYASTRPKGVFVITGPVYKNLDKPTSTIGKTQGWVPDALFKVIIDAETGHVAVFYMPNAAQDNLSKFLSNIAAIELATGIEFDSSLDKTNIHDLQE